MEKKHTFILILIVLVILTLLCAWTGSQTSGQIGTVALGYAVAEQAQANREMAEAVGTQARVSGWTVFFIVSGFVVMACLMVVAMVIGLKAGQRAPLAPVQPLRQLPPIPAYPVSLPEGDPNELTAVELFDLLTAGEEWK